VASASAPVSEEEERANEGCKLRKNTNVTSRCAAHDVRLGKWKPSAKELMVTAPLLSGSCYCASGLIEAIDRCAQKIDGGQIALTLGTLGDPTDCSLTVGAAELGARRFLRIYAFNRDQATFYSIITVVELKGDKAELYYQGFNSFDPPGTTDVDPKQHSAALVKDWPTLPQSFKDWLEKDPE
jgi:hypothetical protein